MEREQVAARAARAAGEAATAATFLAEAYPITDAPEEWEQASAEATRNVIEAVNAVAVLAVQAEGQRGKVANEERERAAVTAPAKSVTAEAQWNIAAHDGRERATTAAANAAEEAVSARAQRSKAAEKEREQAVADAALAAALATETACAAGEAGTELQPLVRRHSARVADSASKKELQDQAKRNLGGLRRTASLPKKGPGVADRK